MTTNVDMAWYKIRTVKTNPRTHTWHTLMLLSIYRISATTQRMITHKHFLVHAHLSTDSPLQLKSKCPFGEGAFKISRGFVRHPESLPGNKMEKQENLN